jgi:hypothetical protein
VVELSVVIVAIEVLATLQVWLAVPDMSWVVLPEHTLVVPLIAPGIGETDRAINTEQGPYVY